MTGGAFMGVMLAPRSREYVPAENRVFVTVADMDHPRVSITNIGRASGSNILIDWGDGTSSTTTSNGTAANQKCDHTYSAPGDYIVTIAQNCMRFGCNASSASEPYTSNKVNVRAVEYSDSITTTASEAFRSAAALVEIRGGRRVSSIGTSAFNGCTSLRSIGSLASCTSIGGYAFNNCSSLQSVGSLASCTSIGSNAFQSCTSLQSVGSLSSCKSLGASAFNGCTSLESIGSLASCTSISNNVFYNCSSLESIGSLASCTSIGASAFGNCSSLISVGSLESCTSLGGSAFSGCSSLQTIGSLASCTSIGSYAFGNCYALTEIEAPGVGVVACRAFQNNYSIRRISLPSCYSLTGYAVPPTTSYIENFGSCHALRELELGTITNVGGTYSWPLSGSTGIAAPLENGVKLTVRLGNTMESARLLAGWPWSCITTTKWVCSDGYIAYNKITKEWEDHPNA